MEQQQYVEFGVKIRHVRFAIRFPCRKKKSSTNDPIEPKNGKDNIASRISTLLRRQKSRDNMWERCSSRASSRGSATTTESSSRRSATTASRRSGTTGSRQSAGSMVSGDDQWIQDFHKRYNPVVSCSTDTSPQQPDRISPVQPTFQYAPGGRSSPVKDLRDLVDALNTSRSRNVSGRSSPVKNLYTPIKPEHTSTPVTTKIVPMNRVALSRRKIESLHEISGVKIYEDMFEDGPSITYENAPTVIYQDAPTVNCENGPRVNYENTYLNINNNNNSVISKASNSYEIVDVNNQVIARLDLNLKDIYFV